MESGRITTENGRTVKVITVCITIVILYAFLQYIFGIVKIQIPGITVNYTDWKNNPTNWFNEKSNRIGSNSKIVSTYQNGNLLGVNILMWFPLAFRFPKKKISTNIIYMIMFLLVGYLTGSRTVYIGIMLYVVMLIFEQIKQRKIGKKTFCGFITTIVIGIFGGGILLNRSSDTFTQRIFNSLNINVFLQGGGRTDKLVDYFRWIWKDGMLGNFLLGSFGFSHDGSSYEMTYCCVFVLGGILGVTLFIVPFIKKVRIGLRQYASGDWMIKGLTEGCLIYAMVAFVDGGYWLPPTALNWWLLLCLLKNNAGNDKTDYRI